jgi:regulator of protease activity HflC (stomatin/prohibitin superfamily)
MEKQIPIKRLAMGIGLVVLLIVGLVSMGSVVENNDAGVYQVRQSVKGDMSVRFEPGFYIQAFDKLTNYQASDILEFDKRDGREEPILVRFQDGGTARVSGSVKVRLPNKEETMLRLHKEFKYHDALKNTLLKPTFTEAVQQTAALMKSEESYSSRRSEFASLLEEQIKRGIFETTAIEVKEKDVDGNEFNDVNIIVKLDKEGKKVVRKLSPFLEYGVEVIQVIIKDIDYDETIDALISKKKEAEQQKVVAKANAEKSKQDTITARERANAEVAIAKGQEEVEKIKEVTRAEKEKAVAILSAQKDYEAAKLARLTAEQKALAETTRGRAEAEINRLKVSAGLTPQERAEIELKKADVVSKNLSQISVPNIVISGGGNGGKTVDPFTAIGLESLMKINDKLSNTK